MKKMKLLLISLLACITASAQGEYETLRLNEFIDMSLRVLGVLLLIYIPCSLILTFVKMLFEYRLKQSMIEKGVSETVVSQMLQPDYKATRFTALKWVCLLCGAGLGLLLAGFFPPFGIHSLVMITFSLAAGFLGYYLLVSRMSN